MKKELLNKIKSKLNSIPLYEMNLLMSTSNLLLYKHNDDFINNQKQLIDNLDIDIDVKNLCLEILKEVKEKSYEKKNY